MIIFNPAPTILNLVSFVQAIIKNKHKIDVNKIFTVKKKAWLTSKQKANTGLSSVAPMDT